MTGKHGGPRPRSGRHPRPKRITLTLRISPELKAAWDYKRTALAMSGPELLGSLILGNRRYSRSTEACVQPNSPSPAPRSPALPS
jgi:hypothetical protein